MTMEKTEGKKGGLFARHPIGVMVVSLLGLCVVAILMLRM